MTCFVKKNPTDEEDEIMSYRVLLIDDNQLALESMEKTIPWAEHDLELVGCASNGIQGCQMIRSLRPDILISDIQMPEMDGYEATRRIRALPDKKKAAIPIVAMTANAFEEDQKNALNAGMNGHIAKPLDIQKLFQVLSELLK